MNKTTFSACLDSIKPIIPGMSIDEFKNVFIDVDWEDQENQDALLEVLPELNNPLGEVYAGVLLGLASGYIFSEKNFLNFCEKVSKSSCIFLDTARQFYSPRFFYLDVIFDNLEAIKEILPQKMIYYMIQPFFYQCVRYDTQKTLDILEALASDENCNSVFYESQFTLKCCREIIEDPKQLNHFNDLIGRLSA